MRFILFYSEIDSFNFAADELEREFRLRGHEVFILDLKNPPEEDPHSYLHFTQFMAHKADAVVCFDGIGCREDLFIEIWDASGAVVIDILMDPPLRFHSTMEKHPANYFLFCCDLEHVEYVKKYFGQSVPYVAFMPHVGVMPSQERPVIPYTGRKYDVLFTGTYYHYQDRFVQIRQMFAEGSDMYRLYECMFDRLVCDSSLTIEKALFDTLEQFGWSVSEEMLKTMLRCSEAIDWTIRTYQRETVINTLAESGMELYLLGKGWKDYSGIRHSNVHIVDGWVDYRRTLEITAETRISLNVMPWFKAGTHDRIFNAILQRSVPLTDSSAWLAENFTDGVDIAYYDLKKLDQLPAIVQHLLTDVPYAEAIIQKGYEKVVHNLTWSNCAEWIISVIQGQ